MTTRTDSIKAQLRRLENELAAIEAVPDPADFADDTVVLFRKTFGRSVTFDGTDRQTYTYAAVKAGGRWFETGRNRAAMTDEEFRIELAAAEVGEISVVESWTQLQ